MPGTALDTSVVIAGLLNGRHFRRLADGGIILMAHGIEIWEP